MFCCVDLFPADLVLILFFPTLALRRLELGSGKAPLLTAPDTEILFLRFILPLAVAVPGCTMITTAFSMTTLENKGWSGNKSFCQIWHRQSGQIGKSSGTLWKKRRKQTLPVAGFRWRMEQGGALACSIRTGNDSSHSRQAPAGAASPSESARLLEEAEKTKDSRLAREFVVALPVELNRDEWITLLTDFIQANFVAEGMCADVCIHDTDGHNPHAHIMLTVRPLAETRSSCPERSRHRFTASAHTARQRTS